MADGKVVIDTELDSSGIKKGMQGMPSIVKKGFGAVTTIAKGTAIAVGAVATAVGAVGASAIKYNASMEQYQTSFEVMTGSAEKAADVMARLREMGAKTPFEFPELAQTTQLLMNYGFTADGAIQRMSMLGDISQGSAEKMQRIATAYGQMSSAGKVQLEDVKQMIEAGFNPLQEISQSTGETMESLYDRISKGTISVDEITASMTRATSEGGKYFQSMDKQSQTLAGRFSTLKDNWNQFTGAIFGSASTSSGSILDLAIGWVDELSTAFTEGGTEAMLVALSDIIAEMVTNVTETAPQMIELATKIIVELLNALIENANMIGQALVNIGIALVNAAIQIFPLLIQLGLQLINGIVQGMVQNMPVLIAMVPQIVDTLVSLFDSMIPLIVEIGVQLLSAIVENLPAILAVIIPAIARINVAIIQAIIQAVPRVISAGYQLIVAIGQRAAEAGGIIAQRVRQIAQNVVQTVSGFVGDMASAGLDMIRGLANGISAGASWVADKIRSICSDSVSVIKDFFGIKSPAKKYMPYLGEMMAEGLGVGFADADVMGQIEQSLSGGVNMLNNKLNMEMSGFAHGGVNFNQTVNVNKEISTPDDISRALRLESRYAPIGGLA